ncbi:Actin filament-binding protein frabin [Intoshia linei]|uniref:Actin filament-binding protein frabin n=1 Tax=Intoshia linei TaxID=1819745 RepID=A0A177B6U5_9BILA|nr:Actin filament-binding protein frabin [Intoshia linei]
MITTISIVLGFISIYTPSWSVIHCSNDSKYSIGLKGIRMIKPFIDRYKYANIDQDTSNIFNIPFNNYQALISSNYSITKYNTKLEFEQNIKKHYFMLFLEQPQWITSVIFTRTCSIINECFILFFIPFITFLPSLRTKETAIGLSTASFISAIFSGITLFKYKASYKSSNLAYSLCQTNTTMIYDKNLNISILEFDYTHHNVILWFFTNFGRFNSEYIFDHEKSLNQSESHVNTLNIITNNYFIQKNYFNLNSNSFVKTSNLTFKDFYNIIEKFVQDYCFETNNKIKLNHEKMEKVRNLHYLSNSYNFCFAEIILNIIVAMILMSLPALSNSIVKKLDLSMQINLKLKSNTAKKGNKNIRCQVGHTLKEDNTTCIKCGVGIKTCIDQPQKCNNCTDKHFPSVGNLTCGIKSCYVCDSAKGENCTTGNINLNLAGCTLSDETNKTVKRMCSPCCESCCSTDKCNIGDISVSFQIKATVAAILSGSNVSEDEVDIKLTSRLSNLHISIFEPHLNVDIHSETSSNSSDEVRSDRKKRSNDRATNIKRINYIIDEIISSENTFAEALNSINKPFKEFIEIKRKETNEVIVRPQLLDEILGQIPKLYENSVTLIDKLKKSNRISVITRSQKYKKKDTNHSIIKYILDQEYFNCYKTYMTEFNKCISLFHQTRINKPSFNNACLEYEKSSIMNNLKIEYNLIKPVQRLPLLRLLIFDYERHCDESSYEHKLSEDALNIVTKIVEDSNNLLKISDSALKIREIQGKLVGKYSFNKSQIFIKDGKVHKQGRKQFFESRLILFNDVLLYTNIVRYGLLLRYAYNLDSLTVKSSDDRVADSYSFELITSTKSSKILCTSKEDRDDWVSIIDKQIKAYHLLIKHDDVSSESEDEDMYIGFLAPTLLADKQTSSCPYCTKPFTLSYRRHHCKSCGKIVCKKCCSCLAPLRYERFKSCNVCFICYFILKEACTSQNQDSKKKSSFHEIIHDEAYVNRLSKRFKMPVSALKRKKNYFEKIRKDMISSSDEVIPVQVRLSKKKWSKYYMMIDVYSIYFMKAEHDEFTRKEFLLNELQIEEKESTNTLHLMHKCRRKIEIKFNTDISFNKNLYKVAGKIRTITFSLLGINFYSSS